MGVRVKRCWASTTKGQKMAKIWNWAPKKGRIETGGGWEVLVRRGESRRGWEEPRILTQRSSDANPLFTCHPEPEEKPCKPLNWEDHSRGTLPHGPIIRVTPLSHFESSKVTLGHPVNFQPLWVILSPFQSLCSILITWITLDHFELVNLSCSESLWVTQDLNNQEYHCNTKQLKQHNVSHITCRSVPMKKKKLFNFTKIWDEW